MKEEIFMALSNFMYWAGVSRTLSIISIIMVILFSVWLYFKDKDNKSLRREIREIKVAQIEEEIRSLEFQLFILELSIQGLESNEENFQKLTMYYENRDKIANQIQIQKGILDKTKSIKIYIKRRKT
jgi:hypothetical protein